MAVIIQNTIKDCGKPGEVEGPYLASCIYEYVQFVDCSAGKTTTNLSRGMDENAYGTMETYSQGTQMKGMGTHTFNKGDIKGTPYSLPIFIGLLGGEWHDYFLEVPPWKGGAQYVNTPQWHLAQNHNHLKFKHRWPMLKYIYKEEKWISKEEYEAGWRCPAQPVAPDGTYLPSMSTQQLVEAGVTCPN